MAIMASWGPMSFVISPYKILAMEQFTTSMTLKEDSENDTSGTQPTNTRGRQLVPITFSETCLAAAGVDPLTRYNTWCALLGNSYPVIIGGRRVSPPRMKLKNVAMSDVTLSNSGQFIKATIAITLEEYSDGKTSKLLSNSSGAGSNASAAETAAATYYATVEAKQAERAAALGATASPTDKATMK